MSREDALVIPCEGALLVGILHHVDGVPEKSAGDPELGLVIVVGGGPQMRVGVNRQFVMMAREMAARGVPTLRFDHRGMGDSSGEYRGFLDMSADIRAAVDALIERVPTVRRVALWGVCESATAISFYAHQDARVDGLLMLNPWIRTEEGEARAYVRHWYLDRVRSPDFWKKLLSGRFDALASLRSFAALLSRTLRGDTRAGGGGGAGPAADALAALPLPQRLEATTARFGGRLHIVISGKDLVAREFLDHARAAPGWREIFARQRCEVVEAKEADHTFSRLEWRDALFAHTASWLDALRRDGGGAVRQGSGASGGQGSGSVSTGSG